MSPLILNSATEKELIQDCIKGDRKSQKKLFCVHASKMMAVCLRYAKNKSEAEDILQEAFIKVFTNLDAYKFEGSFEGWIRRIMINTALKYNVSKASSWNFVSVDDVNDCENFEPGIISSLSEDEMIHFITKLPTGYKNVFNLFVIEGYSHKEISEMLNIEESTSRSQLVKARKMLQEKIQNMHKIAI